jgi:hypothetical protein
MQTVVETPSYLVDAERLFSSIERSAIIYLFSGANVFAKNEKGNLSAAERNSLGALVDGLVKHYKRST